MRAITFLRYETRSEDPADALSNRHRLSNGERAVFSLRANTNLFVPCTVNRVISKRLTDAEAGDVSDHLTGRERSCD
jgi:hypothetical protein